MKELFPLVILACVLFVLLMIVICSFIKTYIDGRLKKVRQQIKEDLSGKTNKIRQYVIKGTNAKEG